MNLSHIFLILLLLLFFIVPVSAKFEDDFNDDNIGEWTIVEGTWSTEDTNSFGNSSGHYMHGYAYFIPSTNNHPAKIYQDVDELYQYYKYDMKAVHTGNNIVWWSDYTYADFYWQYPNYGLRTTTTGVSPFNYRKITGIGFTMTPVIIEQDEWYRMYVATTTNQIRIRVYYENGTEVSDQTVAYTPPDPADGARMLVHFEARYHSTNTGYMNGYIDNIYGWSEWPGIGVLTVPSIIIVNEVADLTYTFTESDFTNFDYFIYVYTPSGALTSYTITSPTPEVFEYATMGRSEGTYATYLVGKSITTGEAYVMDYKEMVLNSTVEAYGYTIDATTWTNLSSTNVSYYQALTYHNTTSDANGFYSVDDLLVDYLIHINATKTNYTHDDFSVTPTFSYNNSVDLYLFPSNRSLSGTSIVEGMTVNYPWHQGIGGVTVNIYNTTWSNTTTSDTHGYYIFNLSALVNGTYTVNATLTGYENSTEYDVTVTKNESTVQNIVLNKKYTLTVTARDAATSSPLSTFTTTVDGTQTLTTNGTTTHSLEYGIYLVSVGADDYISASEYALMIMDRSVELSLGRYSEDQSGIYYSPHYVKFTVQNIWGTKYNGVDVSVYNGSEVDTSFTATTGEHGEDGAVGFELSETTQYRITFINSTAGISREITIYPVDTHYIIYVDTLDLGIPDTTGDDVSYYWTTERINSTHAYINFTWTDTSSSSTDFTYWINDSDNSPLAGYPDTTTTTNYSNSTIVPASSDRYYVHVIAEHPTWGEIEASEVIFFGGRMIDLGWSEDWHYSTAAFCGIVFVGLLFGAVTAHYGAVVAVMFAWFFRWVGWLDTSSTSTLLLILASVVAIGFCMRKGEVVRV